MIYLFCVVVLFIVYSVYYYFYKYDKELDVFSKTISGPERLPIIGNTYTFILNSNDILNYFGKLFDRYGSIYRFSLLNRVYLVTKIPEDLAIILQSPHCLEKDQAMYKAMQPYIHNSLVLAPVEKWKRHRKILQPSFQMKLLEKSTNCFKLHGFKLCDNLKKYVGEFDVGDEVNKCTLNILLDNFMGIDSDNLDIQTNYFNCVKGALKMIRVKTYNPLYCIDAIFKFTHYATIEKELIHNFYCVADKIFSKLNNLYGTKTVEHTDSKINQDKTMFERVVELNHNNVLTSREIIENVNTFIIAGSDTTSSTLSFLLVMLGMHPNIQERVYKEIMEFIALEKDIRNSHLNNLKYTNMVIKETLRLFPFISVVYRYTTNSVKISKCTIPKSTGIMIPIYYLQRDEKYWKDPLIFNPDRFLPENIEKQHPSSWIPFSSGPRNCIGYKFAMMELQILVAVLVKNFIFHTSYKSVAEIELKLETFLKPVHGHKISFQKRI